MKNTGYLFLAVIFTIRSLGMSLVNMPINTWGINALDNRYIAHGNAVNNTARQLGGSIGTAFLITIMTLVMKANTASGITHATLLGINTAFGVSAGIIGIALILSIFKVKIIKFLIKGGDGYGS